jgi:protein TonB
MMQQRNSFLVCFVISIVIHLFLLHFLFGINEKKISLSIPIDVSFYYPPNIKRAETIKQEENPETKKTDILEEIKENSFVEKKEQNDGDNVTVNKKKLKRKLDNKKNKSTKKKSKIQNKDIEISKKDTVAENDNEVSPYSSVHFDNKNFKYQYYAEQIVKKIGQQFAWAQSYGKLRTLIFFKISKNGSVTEIILKESSGNKEFDTYSLDVIRRAEPFADLPEKYKEDFLGVYFEFKYNN